MRVGLWQYQRSWRCTVCNWLVIYEQAPNDYLTLHMVCCECKAIREFRSNMAGQEKERRTPQMPVNGIPGRSKPRSGDLAMGLQ